MNYDGEYVRIYNKTLHTCAVTCCSQGVGSFGTLLAEELACLPSYLYQVFAPISAKMTVNNAQDYTL
jgi:hypothetical protein